MTSLAESWMLKGMKQGVEKGIEQGIEKGIEKGIEQGVKKGSMLEKQQTAKRLLMLKVSLDIIADATGLTESQILDLADQQP